MSEHLPIPAPDGAGEFVLYQTEDGRTRLEVRMAHETVWLSQLGIADLFQTTKQNVNLHLQNVFEEGELDPAATVKQYLTVQTEGSRQIRRAIDHCYLDAILGECHVPIAGESPSPRRLFNDTRAFGPG